MILSISLRSLPKPKKGAESSDYCIHEPQFHDNTKLCSWTSHWVPECSSLRNLACQVLTSICKGKFMQVSQRLKKVMATEQSPTKLYTLPQHLTFKPHPSISYPQRIVNKI